MKIRACAGDKVVTAHLARDAAASDRPLKFCPADWLSLSISRLCRDPLRRKLELAVVKMSVSSFETRKAQHRFVPRLSPCTFRGEDRCYFAYHARDAGSNPARFGESHR